MAKVVDQMLDSDVNYSKRSVQRYLYNFIDFTLRRIKENMRIQRIGKYNPNAKWDGVGDLERSIEATVIKSSGGNEALARIFYNYYASYVELAVQNKMPYSPIPEMQSKRAVKVEGKSRLAKPFLNSQLRRELRKLLTRIGKEYTYAGAAAFYWTLDQPDNPEIHNKNEWSLQQLANYLDGNDR